MGENVAYNLTATATELFLDRYELSGPNFADTPRRVARAWEEFFNHPAPTLTTFPSCNNEMVILKDFVVWGYCPHHLLPVRYTFKIGYIPNGKVLGLSKMPRIAMHIVSKMPLQEDLPCLITDVLEDALHPMGSGCLVDGYHLCMVMRGVRHENATFRTTKLNGVMLLNPPTHDEFVNA